MWGFRPRQLEETDPERLRQRPTTGNENIDVSGPSLQFLAVVRCRNHLATLLSSSSLSKIPNLSLEFRCYLSRDITTSAFGGHSDTSGCRSLLVFPVIWPPSWIYGTHRCPMTSAVPLLKSVRGSRWNFLAMCSRTRDMPGGYFYPPPRCR